MPDEWEELHGGCDRFGGGTNDWDGDGMTDEEEYVADTNPSHPASRFCIAGLVTGIAYSVVFSGSEDRVYSLDRVDNLTTGEWQTVAGQTNKPGLGDGTTLTSPAGTACGFYRVNADIP